jgi:hypothetical protein
MASNVALIQTTRQKIIAPKIASAAIAKNFAAPATNATAMRFALTVFVRPAEKKTSLAVPLAIIVQPAWFAQIINALNAEIMANLAALEKIAVCLKLGNALNV